MGLRIGRRMNLLFDEWLLETPLAAINSLSPAKMFGYSARQCTPGASGVWTARVGETMAAVGSGGSIIDVLAANCPKAVRTLTGGDYLAATNGFAALGTKDYLIEGIACPAVGALWSGQQGILTYMNDPTSFADLFTLDFSGISVTTTKISHYLQFPYPTTASAVSVVCAGGQYIHFWLACNRGEASAHGARIGINGALGGTGGDFSAFAAVDLAFNKPLSLGGTWDAVAMAGLAGGLVMIQGWYAQDWIAAGAAGQTEIETIMAKRFAMST